MRNILLAAPLALAACSGGGASPSDQVGANPPLPAINQYLMPPMHVARIAPWNGAMPAPAAGLQVQPFATGLHNVRSIFVLPNGDVLAVEPKGPQEPVARPKDIVVNWVQGFGHSDISGKDQITLLRDTDGDGRADQRSVFLDHLHSPFGVALVGGDLYVANTDAIVRYPYAQG